MGRNFSAHTHTHIHTPSILNLIIAFLPQNPEQPGTSSFPGGSVVKNPPAMQEIWVQSLDWEDPQEKEKATHSSILAWRISWV